MTNDTETLLGQARMTTFEERTTMPRRVRQLHAALLKACDGHPVDDAAGALLAAYADLLLKFSRNRDDFEASVMDASMMLKAEADNTWGEGNEH